MQRKFTATVEWPTLALLAGTYLLWAFGTTFASGLWLPLGIALTALAITQFSSLQHEVLHGHPFADQRLNELCVFPGLTLVIPYERFRDLHLAHHYDPVLTDPYDDPESNYLDPAEWARMPLALRLLRAANNVLLGRILLGPAISTISFLRAEWRRGRDGDRAVQQAWEKHSLGVAIVLAWLILAGRMPLWAYGLSAYAGLGLLKIRTFLEHRAHERARGRTVIIEDRGLLALLFLNNNLHAVHHQHPTVAWYRLPALYSEGRERYLALNEGYVYRSYAADLPQPPAARQGPGRPSAFPELRSDTARPFAHPATGRGDPEAGRASTAERDLHHMARATPDADHDVMFGLWNRGVFLLVAGVAVRDGSRRGLGLTVPVAGDAPGSHPIRGHGGEFPLLRIGRELVLQRLRGGIPERIGRAVGPGEPLGHGQGDGAAGAVACGFAQIADRLRRLLGRLERIVLP